MGNYIVLFVIGSLLSLNLFIIQVNGTCDMENRIKNRDPDLVVSATESPCQMVVSSNERRQVVIVIYNYGRNCIGSGVMTISDGTNIQNKTVINSACRATDISFISRNRGLVITLTSPYQPFDIDLHLIETENQYYPPAGTVVSPRYPSSDGGYTSATPNNYHGKHSIVSTHNVSMFVNFTEIRIQPSPAGVTSTCTRDVLRVLADSTLRAEFCGDGVKPQPVNVIANELTLEYVTDNYITYPGFSVDYNVCTREVDDSSDGMINFQGFPTLKRRCMFIIKLTQKGKIRLALELNTQRNCSQAITIFPNDESSIPAMCNEVQEVTGKVIRIVFDLENNESIKGNYSIDSSSTEQGSSGKEGSSPFSDEKTASATGVIVGIVMTVVFFIIVIVIGIIVYKRKKNKNNRKPSLRMNEIGENVYEDKEDYDQLNVKRDHIKTSNDQNSNVYGRMISSEVQDEYAVVNKGDKEPAEISANEYGAETFSTEYEETTKPTAEKNVIDDNVYE